MHQRMDRRTERPQIRGCRLGGDFRSLVGVRAEALVRIGSLGGREAEVGEKGRGVR